MDVQEHQDGVTIRIRVQPRASKNRIVGPFGDALKVAVTAPAVDGAANEAVIEFLAAKINTSRNQVAIVTGHTSRTKLVKFFGISKDELMQKLV